MYSLAEFKSKIQSSGAVRWPLAPPLEFFWCFEMKASREEIWEYLADTSRFNRELGMAKRTQEEVDGKVIVRTTMIGIPQRWVEEPWTWLAGETIASHRTYQQGLAKKVHALFHINDEGENRQVYIYFGWTPKNFLWGAFLKMTENLLRGNFVKAFTKIDAHFAGQKEKRQSRALGKLAPALSPKQTAALASALQNLSAKKMPAPHLESLHKFIFSADDFDAEFLRVRKLAREWNFDFRDLLTTFLHATQEGLLKISWRMICPHCRGSRFSAAELGEIPEHAECTACKVEFSTSTEEAVEVVFHIHPSVRKVEEALYCAAEPAKKPHIKIQQSVKPGESLEISYNFPAEGKYRVRVSGTATEHSFDVERAGTKRDFSYRNDTKDSVLFVLENLWWEDQILKPVHVFANPDFRGLFSQEHLNSKVRLYLGEQAILFTDIVGSTAFYNQVGDAKAFAEVSNHFQEIFAQVKKERGVVVKTIGDAVMAAFPSLSDALEAAVGILQRFHDGRADSPIRLRISVHSGQVMAVHLNSGIDYFGSSVNFTAKIQGAADAHEIALSRQAFELFQKIFPPGKLEYSVTRASDAKYLAGAEIYVVNLRQAPSISRSA